MRLSPAKLAVSLAPLAIACPAIASAQAAPPAGRIAIFATPTHAGNTGTVLITGAIGDYGTYTSSNQDGTANPSGSYIKFVLKKGTFEINASKLTDSHKAGDRATCSVVFSGTAHAPVSNGTGQYSGIRGTLTVTLLHAILAPTYASGPRKGQCEAGKGVSIRPLDEYDSLSATGIVSGS